MIYDVHHTTTFDYEEVVSVSHHVLHLAPRNHPRQRCVAAALAIEPPTSVSSAGEDYFGNPVHYLTVQEPHERLRVESRARVEVLPSDPGVSTSEPWEAVKQMLDEYAAAAIAAYEYRFESPYVAGNEDVRRYAAESFVPGRPLLDAVAELTARIFREFEYRGGVSDVSTPVRDVLAMRKGVCQDFAHFEIACLRSVGLAARYVSGYLLTRPPEGKQKLVGRDASHAWLSVWCGANGWADFDPTNNLRAGDEHITIAWGRDYGDVSPINGFIVGGGTHQVAVAVDVSAAEPATVKPFG